MRRCHFLLQQGRSAADIAYFIGEDAPKMTGTRSPELPAGYDYDYINAEALLKRARVERGKLVIPDGPSYSLLVLPPQETMRPELLRRVRDLVKQGAAILGPPPQRSPSLENYPVCDRQVKALAREVWGELAVPAAGGLVERGFGKGRVFCGADIAEALKRLKAAPAISCPPGILWTLRKTADEDIYFLSNQNNKPLTADVSFRVTERTPEFWHPDMGTRERTARFVSEEGRTVVSVPLDAHGSVFVVFRKPAKATAKPVLSADLTPVLNVAGPWRLKRPDGAKLELPELISWSDSADPAMRYFAGAATYEKEFQLPATMAGKGRRVMLDLGRVEVIAEVRVNGNDLGVVWKQQFAVDITGAAKPGTNTLEIKVTNHWWNRLVGDDKLPATERGTFTTAPPRSPRTKLLPAGLIGPVTVRSSVASE